MFRLHAIRPMAVVISFVASVAACDGRETRILPVPSNTPVLPAPAPPAPTPPSPAPSGVTLFGSAFEITVTGGKRPLPNLRLKVRAGSAADGAVGGVDLPDVITDANGRYAIPDVPGALVFVTTAPGSDYRFLCDFYPLLVRARPSPLSDLPLVHASWSGDRLPAGMWSPGTSVHGTVSERVNGILHPVAGASVTLETGRQDPPATTSETGFYMICTVVGTDQYRTITARKDGYAPAIREFFGGSESRIDLEIARD